MERDTLSRVVATWLIAGIAVGVGVIAWFAFRATWEWRSTSMLLAERRLEQAADLLARALARDMQGADETVLRQLQWSEVTLERPSDISNVVAAAFARYPYPEAFFGWDGDAASPVVIFTRTDRRPEWLPGTRHPVRFPVAVVAQRSPDLDRVVARLSTSASQGERLSVFETSFAGQPYHVVARLVYHSALRDHLHGVFGFVVNQGWVRQRYFGELIEQIARVADSGDRLGIALLDQNDRLVAGEELPADAPWTASRAVRPLFFDPVLTGRDAADEPYHRVTWTVKVSAARDPTLALATQGVERTLTVAAGSAACLVLALLLAARALRASAELARVRSDFVSSVTHELKTPLATILAVGDAFVHERLVTRQEVRDYAHILDQQAKRLIRLVDNLLAYSRVTEVSKVYSFEAIAVSDLIEDTLRTYQPQFDHAGIVVAVDTETDLPMIHGDCVALTLALDNLIANALQHGGDGCWLAITARRDGRHVRLLVSDRGKGIPPDETARVTERFIRGRSATSSGSGLGLAIAKRVAEDHNGRLSLTSSVGRGTTVELLLPAMESRA